MRILIFLELLIVIGFLASIDSKLSRGPTRVDAIVRQFMPG